MQVFQRPVAPVPDDRLGEGLAVAAGAVEIDHDHGVAHAGPDLRVPAIAPGVAEGSVRAAVDQEGHGIFAAGLEVGRLDHIAVHGFAVPAGETEGFETGEWGLGQRVLTDVRELFGGAACAQLKDLRG